MIGFSARPHMTSGWHSLSPVQYPATAHTQAREASQQRRLPVSRGWVICVKSNQDRENAK